MSNQSTAMIVIALIFGVFACGAKIMGLVPWIVMFLLISAMVFVTFGVLIFIFKW